MTAGIVFRLCSSVAILGWLLLIFSGFLGAGRLKHVVSFLSKFILPGLLSVAYLIIILMHWAEHPGGFGSAVDVQKLFGDLWLVVAGWAHYLAFDLFLGAWEVRDAQRSNVPHLWAVPCLILTFLFGPIGFLLYLLLKTLRSPTLRNTDDAHA